MNTGSVLTLNVVNMTCSVHWYRVQQSADVR